MDSHKTFFKLGFGAKFDLKRFGDDAAKVKVFKKLSKPEQGPLVEEQKYEWSKNENNVDEAEAENSEKDDDRPLRLMKNLVATGESQSTNDLSGRKKKKKKSVSVIEKQKKTEEVSRFRKQKKIYMWGTDIPDPCPSFETMIDRYKIGDLLAETMRQLLASWTPTPIQMQAIPLMLRGREILGSAPTGSGKTLAFVIPLLHHLRESQRGGFRAVIIEPTRELAKQIYREVMRFNDKLGLRVYMISNVDAAREKFGSESKRRFDILITTPNRLVHLLNEDPPCLDLSKVEWLIVDESDKLFETGRRGFRDQLAKIYQSCDGLRCRRAFFSATFSYDVEQWCKTNLDNVVMVSIGARNTAVETVQQELLFVGNEYGKVVAVRNLISTGLLPPILIFVQTKERAQQLCTEMRHHDKMKVDVIHSDRDQKERAKVVKRFRKGDIWILICTELMGRGIDFKNVNVVINYDFPPSAISYIHRIGRTGRAGRSGRAVTFFTEDDRPLLRSIANVMREAGCPTPDYMLQLKKPSKRSQQELARQCADRPKVAIRRTYDRKRKWRNSSSSAKDAKTIKRRKVTNET